MEQMIVAQLVKTFFVFCETEMFIVATHKDSILNRFNSFYTSFIYYLFLYHFPIITFPKWPRCVRLSECFIDCSILY
jgi:hypothetical protein